MLLSASKQSLAPSTDAQEVTVRFSLTDGQAEKLRQKGTLHFTLTAFGYRVEYLVDCPALAILPRPVSAGRLNNHFSVIMYNTPGAVLGIPPAVPGFFLSFFGAERRFSREM